MRKAILLFGKKIPSARKYFVLLAIIFLLISLPISPFSRKGASFGCWEENCGFRGTCPSGAPTTNDNSYARVGLSSIARGIVTKKHHIIEGSAGTNLANFKGLVFASRNSTSSLNPSGTISSGSLLLLEYCVVLTIFSFNAVKSSRKCRSAKT